jgi:CysZ protein
MEWMTSRHPVEPDTTKGIDFWHGLRTVPRAVDVLRNVPQVLRLLLIPLLLTALLDGLALYYGFGYLHQLILLHVPQSGLFGLLSGFLTLLAGVLVVAALAWTFGFVYLTLCELVVDSVSEQIEEHLTGHSGSTDDWGSKLRGVLIGLGQSLLLTLIGILSALIGMIPIVGPLIAIPLGATALGYGFFAISAGRKGHSLSQRWQKGKDHLAALCGLGLPLFVINLIPVVNLLALPVFIVAGTLLYLDTEQRS